MKILSALLLNFLLCSICYATPSIRDAYEGGISIEFVVIVLVALWVLGKFTDKPGEWLGAVMIVVVFAAVLFGFGSAVISFASEKPFAALVTAYACFYIYYFFFRKKK